MDEAIRRIAGVVETTLAQIPSSWYPKITAENVRFWVGCHHGDCLLYVQHTDEATAGDPANVVLSIDFVNMRGTYTDRQLNELRSIYTNLAVWRQAVLC